MNMEHKAKSPVLLAFPTQFEAQGLINKLQSRRQRHLGKLTWFEGEIDSTPLWIAIIGMGAEHAVSSTELFLNHIDQERGLKPALFILSGFAGALVPGYRKGDIIIADTPTAHQLLPDQKTHFAQLYTSPIALSTRKQKAQAAAQTGCSCVDMELAPLVSVLEKWAIPLLCIRAISDLADEDLPLDVLTRGYDIQRARPTPLRLALYLLLHPWRIPAFVRFVWPLGGVRFHLTKFLSEKIVKSTFVTA